MRDRTGRKGGSIAIAAITVLILAACSSGQGGSGHGSTTGSGAGNGSGPAQVGSGGTATVVSGAASAVQLVDVAQGLELVADTSVVVVDVRTPAEFAAGHLDRAELVDIGAPEFRDRIAQFDRSATYFVYCHSGNRSGQATAIMAELGFDTVYNLDGGIQAWIDAGAPVVK